MYNGQFIKGLVHVLVFVILIGITEDHGIFGIFIAAWIAYQIFDAYETAKARRDGRPLPDPFGLNELGAKLGIPNPNFMGTPTPPMPPSTGAGFSPAAGFTDPYAQPYSAVPPPPPMPPLSRRREPVGALVLIGLGLLFLLNTMDIFHFDWIGHLWPLLIIGFGVLLFVRRSREIPPPPPPPSSGGLQ